MLQYLQDCLEEVVFCRVRVDSIGARNARLGFVEYVENSIIGDSWPVHASAPAFTPFTTKKLIVNHESQSDSKSSAPPAP